MSYRKFDKNSQTYKLLNADTGLDAVIKKIKKMHKPKKDLSTYQSIFGSFDKPLNFDAQWRLVERKGENEESK